MFKKVLNVSFLCRIEEQLKRDQESCTRPDTETPFRGKIDAVQRLLG